MNQDILDLAKLFAANTAAASITAPIPTLTPPSGDGILMPATNLGRGSIAWLHFFGAGADNATMTARLTVWKRAGTLWIPTPLLALDITLGATIGVAGGEAIATDRFADTITASTGFTSAAEIINPADDSPAAVKVDLCGAHALQVQLAKGTATNCNALGCMF